MDAAREWIRTHPVLLSSFATILVGLLQLVGVTDLDPNTIIIGVLALFGLPVAIGTRMGTRSREGWIR